MECTSLLELPHDVLAHILQFFFRYGDFQTYFNIAVTCSSLCSVANSDTIWSEVVIQFPVEYRYLYGGNTFGSPTPDALAFKPKPAKPPAPREKRFLDAMATKHMTQVRRLNAKLNSFYVCSGDWDIDDY